MKIFPCLSKLRQVCGNNGHSIHRGWNTFYGDQHEGKLNFVAGLFLSICNWRPILATLVENRDPATLNRSIYVDGSRVDLAGYTSQHGYNYFKLRDIAALWTLVSNGI